MLTRSGQERRAIKGVLLGSTVFLFFDLLDAGHSTVTVYKGIA
jgi:hypothetical protein